MSKKQIVIVGAGITGLSLAYYLNKHAKENHLDWQIRVLDANKQSGGIISSYREGETLFEKGPDSFLNEKPTVLELCHELNIADQVISTQSKNRCSFIVQNKKLIRVPEGFYLIGPSKVWPFLNSPIFSLAGKCRMIAEYFIPAKKNIEDESVASFVRRRFGQEALERMAQPMLAGIYTGDPETLSLRMTMPKFLDMEAKHGSVIRALRSKAATDANAVETASGPRYGLFLSFKDGMQTLTNALEAQLPQGTVIENTKVKDIVYNASQKSWLIRCGEQSFSADVLCLGVAAAPLASMIQNITPELSAALSKIAYESVVTLNLVYKRSAIAHPLNGFGFVVGAKENSCLVGCSFSSQKYSHRAASDEVLLRAFIGGAFGQKYYDRSDEDIISMTCQELSKILNISEKPKRVLLTRWPESMIQYKTGYKDFINTIDQAILKFPGLVVAGSIRGGVGISDRVAQSKQLVSQISEFLK